MRYLPLLLLTACAGAGNAVPVPNAPVPTYTVHPIPSTLPSPVPSVIPCKALASTWVTASQPSTKLLGVYTGPPTVNPPYTLDLTHLATGLNTFTYDSTHVCYYDITKLTNAYRIESFQGCTPGEIPPGHPANEQCDYCPDAYTAGHTFNYTLSCHALTITDTQTSQSLTYQ